MLYEADVMQDQRILDIDDVRVFGSKAVPGRGGKLRIVNPFAFSGVTEDGWQIQNPERLKKKLKRIMVLELSRKDVMPDERAKAVSKKSEFARKKRSIETPSCSNLQYCIADAPVACGLRRILAAVVR